MTLTSEDVQRYVRIGIYYLSGTLTTYGFGEAGGLITASSGVILFAANLAWTIFGMRVNAKIAEMNKLAKIESTPIAGVIMTNTLEGRQIANSLDGPTVTAGSNAAKQLAA